MKRLVLDLDNTLTQTRGEGVSYRDVLPDPEMVEKVRHYKADGFAIIIATSRNMRSYNNSIGEINAKTLPIIIEWLEKHQIPYDEIHVGKPWCGHDGFYVDDRAIRPDEFLKLPYEKIRELVGEGD